MITARLDAVTGFWTWELSEFGFYMIRESLGPIKDHGFRSASHHHDRLVQAFQLADWINQPDLKPQHVTEQELIRYEKESWLPWVPRSEFHRPDGYTPALIDGTPCILAIEVEIVAKSVSRYATVIRSYQLARDVDRIYWLVDDPYVAVQIQKAIDEVRETSKNYHLFVDLADFEKLGSNAIAKSERPENYRPLEETLGTTTGLERGDHVGTHGPGRRGTDRFDSRKFVGVQNT